MVDVIVHKPSPYGLVFLHDKPLGQRPRVYHLSHQTGAGLYIPKQLTSLRETLVKMMVSTFPKAFVNKKNDWQTDFIDVGAWKK